MTSSKRFFLSLVPPLFLSAYYRLRRKNIKPSPAWHTVKSGPSMGTELFVDTQNESFAEMTEGSYDNFLWQYLSGQTIRGEYIVDIGAHIGYHTLALVKYLDDVKNVLAFEPNIFNAERLQMNLNRNINLTEKVLVRRIALSDKQGTARFRFSDNVDNATSSGSHLTEINPPQSISVYERHKFREFEVQTNTLDAEIKQLAPNSLALIKIDVEGAEHLVLRGATETIRLFKLIIIIEIHSVECMLEVTKITQALDYDYEMIMIEEPSRGFIACTPKKD